MENVAISGLFVPSVEPFRVASIVDNLFYSKNGST